METYHPRWTKYLPRDPNAHEQVHPHRFNKSFYKGMRGLCAIPSTRVHSRLCPLPLNFLHQLTWRKRIPRGRVCWGPRSHPGNHSVPGLVHRTRACGGSNRGVGYHRRRDLVRDNRSFPLSGLLDVVDVHHSPTGFLRFPACVRAETAAKNNGTGGGGRGGAIHARSWHDFVS